MTKQIKESISKVVFSTAFSYLLISILFFFAWSDLVLELTGVIEWWFYTKYSIWFYSLWGLFTPVLLLIGAVQYKSKLAYRLTLMVFIVTIIINLVDIPSYLREYEYKKIYGSTLCSCCPICEIKTIFQLTVCALLAIFLMSRKKMLKIYIW